MAVYFFFSLQPKQINSFTNVNIKKNPFMTVQFKLDKMLFVVKMSQTKFEKKNKVRKPRKTNLFMTV